MRQHHHHEVHDGGHSHSNQPGKAAQHTPTTETTPTVLPYSSKQSDSEIAVFQITSMLNRRNMTQQNGSYEDLMSKNKNKQIQSETETNDYERKRQQRVQDNKKRMQEFGLKKISGSLTSLVDSQKMKKSKVKPNHNNARDVDYIPDNGDDSDADHQEADISVELSKKKHCSKYIAPLSINTMAKKNRVSAPKPPQKFLVASKATKENQRRSTITMGELVSKMQTRLLNKKTASPNCVNRGSNRLSLLVDEDDDEDVDIELKGLENIENEGDSIMISEDEGDQDGEYEDMEDMTIANNENDIQMDENEYDAHPIELHRPTFLKTTEISKTKKRGPTMLHVVHTRITGQREVIICNEFGQPVGPKDVAGTFSRFLGTIARNHSHAPLIHSSWHKVPHKEKIWEYVLEKFDVPDAAKKWVLKSIGHLYKVNKCRVKRDHFYKFKDNKTRWKNRPNNIPEDDFRQLLRLWSNKDVEERCKRAKQFRMSQKNMHTAGPKSFARIREEMKTDDPNQQSPTLTQLFERTRKRTEGRVYLDVYDDTVNKIEQMKKYKPAEDDNAEIDPFLAVMNKENHGYRRLYGRGVTNTMIRKVDSASTSYMISEGLMESFKTNVEVEKKQLLEMRKEIEDDHERKKAELVAMREDIDNQRQNLDALMRKVMEQLPVRE